MLTKQKSSESWYAVIYPDGVHQKWLSLKTTDRKIAQIRYDKLKIKYKLERDTERFNKAMGLDKPKSELLLITDIFDKYCSIKEPSINTYKTLARFLTSLDSGLVFASEITPDMALKYLQKNYGKQAPKTFNTNKSSLSLVFETLKFFGVKNPFAGIGNRKFDSVHYRAFSRDEVLRLLEACGETYYYGLVLICLYTGLRKGDIVELQWSDIKDNVIVKIPNKTERNKRAVYIPLHNEILKFLETLDKSSEYLFPLALKGYNGGYAHRLFEDILTKAKIITNSEGVASFHSLRATFITNCEEHGISRQVIQGFVGHKSPLMTELYSQDTISAKQVCSLSNLK